MILTLGINHLTAPLTLREQVAVQEAHVGAVLNDFRRTTGAVETVLLSTCNRTEWLAVVDAEREPAIIAWLTRQFRVAPDLYVEHGYRHAGRAAVRHLFRVGAGLDSMVLGESQILGQLKTAYELAKSAGTVGPVLEQLLQQSFAVAKRVRSQTAIGRGSMSVAQVAIKLATRVYGRLDTRAALIIGAGEIAELAAQQLRSDGIKVLYIANRTVERAVELAARYHGVGLPLTALDQVMASADIVISSTGAGGLIVTRSMIEAALRRRRRAPMVMLDLALPRDIDPALGELDDIYLYDLDDLRSIADSGLDQRKRAAAEAEVLIEVEVDSYERWQRSLDAQATIGAIRAQLQITQDQALERGLSALRSGKDPEAVLRTLAHQLTQRLMHEPSVRLRDAGAGGDQRLVDAARQLFGLEGVVASSARVSEPRQEP